MQYKMIRILIFLAVFLSGCSPFYRVSVGSGYSGPISRMTPGFRETAARYIEGGVGWENHLTDRLWQDNMWCGQFVMPYGADESNGIGIEHISRFRYDFGKWEPLIAPHVGFLNTNKKWDGQATTWGFSLGGSLGLRYEVEKNTWITGEYRLYHFSNGSRVFGSPRPNDGYNIDLFILGAEFKW